MRVAIQTEFLCSYYYHAAKIASDEILNHKLPHSLYYGLSGLILWQCVFESYANFQIRQYKLEKFSIKPKNGRSRLLKDSSIKEKWIYLPIARNQKQFTLNKEPFTHFASLVDIRNDLIHFNHASMYFQKEAPLGVSTMGELNDWMKTGDFLSGSLFDSVLRYARAGSLIVRDMFYEYCKLTGEPLPAFLEGHEAVLKVKVVKKS